MMEEEFDGKECSYSKVWLDYILCDTDSQVTLTDVTEPMAFAFVFLGSISQNLHRK